MYHVVARIDDIGRPAWIALMVLGFIVYWPIGLAILAYIIWSGRMGCASRYGDLQDWRNRATERWERHMQGWGGHHRGGMRPTGNRAFDEYRQEALRKLQEEADEFKGFLERLRMAKDRAEFDQFMTERRDRPAGGPGEPQGPAPQPQV